MLSRGKKWGLQAWRQGAECSGLGGKCWSTGCGQWGRRAFWEDDLSCVVVKAVRVLFWCRLLGHWGRWAGFWHLGAPPFFFNYVFSVLFSFSLSAIFWLVGEWVFFSLSWSWARTGERQRNWYCIFYFLLAGAGTGRRGDYLAFLVLVALPANTH